MGLGLTHELDLYYHKSIEYWRWLNQNYKVGQIAIPQVNGFAYAIGIRKYNQNILLRLMRDK